MLNTQSADRYVYVPFYPFLMEHACSPIIRNTAVDHTFTRRVFVLWSIIIAMSTIVGRLGYQYMGRVM